VEQPEARVKHVDQDPPRRGRGRGGRGGGGGGGRGGGHAGFAGLDVPVGVFIPQKLIDQLAGVTLKERGREGGREGRREGEGG